MQELQLLKIVDFHTFLQHLMHVSRIMGMHRLKELCQVNIIDAGKVFVVETIGFILPDAFSHSCSEITYFTISDAITHISNIQF
jgi:hypothetical protein